MIEFCKGSPHGARYAFVGGLVNIAEGLLNVLTLGYVATKYQLKYWMWVARRNTNKYYAEHEKVEGLKKVSEEENVHIITGTQKKNMGC